MSDLSRKKTGYFPLSSSQLNIWNLEASLRGSAANNISVTIKIEGRVDFVLLQQSVQLILKNNPSLRTRIEVDEANEPYQYFEPFYEEDVQIYDLSQVSKEGIANWEATMTREPIPIMGGPLFRFLFFHVGENEGGILVKTHHIISDGWSQILICNKIAKAYLDLLAQNNVEMKEWPSYKIHVDEEIEYLESKHYQKDKDYWTSILEQIDEPSVLKPINSAAVSTAGNRLSIQLPQVINHEINAFCKKNRVAPFAVFYMALAIYFSKTKSTDQFTIGVPILNRTTFQSKQITGMYVTTLPFFKKINPNWSLNDFNLELRDEWLEMLKHQRFPYSHIEELQQSIKGETGRLFNIALSFQNNQMIESTDSTVSVSGRWHYSGFQAEQLCIHLTNFKNQKSYCVDYDYLTQFFTEEEIRNLHHTVCNILFEGLSNPEKPIKDIQILSMVEKEQLVYTFNESDTNVETTTVVNALMDTISKYPDRIAAIEQHEKLSYQQLDEASDHIAYAIAEKQIEDDTLVALMLPRGINLLKSMVGVLKTGRPYVLLTPDLPKARVKHILNQSETALLISSRTLVQDNTEDYGIPVLYLEDVEPNQWAKEKVQSWSELAYVVYTSGSTGEPKGVEVFQSSLINLANGMKPIYGKDAILSICNVGFDAFMLESIVPLLCGKTVVIADDEEAQSPRSLAKIIKKYAVGFCLLTPSRLSAFIKDPSFCKALRQMEGVLCGGEAFPPSLLKELKNLCDIKIYNQYGPSEATVAVSLKELSKSNRITAGKPMDNCRLYVLDQWLNPLPVEVNGRLYIGGACVGKGYRNNPELTDQFFMDSPFEEGERLYYTGDLARWSRDGEIIISGRLDQQVKLRGLRVEPEETAACIMGHPKIEQAAAKVCDINGQSVLVAYYSTMEKVTDVELLTFMASYLPSYMIPAKLVKVEHIPITENGKVDMKKLPTPDLEAVEQSMQPSLHLGEANLILELFKNVLDQHEMSIDSDYFLFGGNSLNAMETIALIEDKLGKRIRVADLYACRNARLLADHLGKGETTSLQLEKSPKRETYPLSPFQQGIYVQSYLDQTKVAYNMPGAFKLHQDIDTTRIEDTFQRLIDTDDIFRTAFTQGSDGIRGTIADSITFHMDEITGTNIEEAMNNFVRPFDLQQAPLLRAGIWNDEEGNHYLFIDSHHIIGDGMSTPIVLNRLNSIFCGQDARPEFSYHDYVWHLQNHDRNQLSSKLDYWRNTLSQIPEPLEFPTDFPRQHHFDFKGSEYTLRLDQKTSELCDTFCQKEGITNFGLFLAAFGLLASRICSREDMMIGIPIAGRTLPQTREICGPFINTLPARLKPNKEKTVKTYFEELRNEITGIIDHQDVSLEELITMLELPRGEQNPLYQVMFSQSPVDEASFKLDNKPMEFIPMEASTVKMDMTVENSKTGGEYIFKFSYATGLFLPETIAYYGRCLKRIVEQFMSGIEKPLKDISVLAIEDQSNLIDTPNYMTTSFVNLPIHKLIEQKLSTDPDRAAIVFHGEAMSRKELEERACALAWMLKKAGVEPGQCIGLGFSRTPDIIAGMYAILKTGCAYVPLLPSLPKARLTYMLETAKVGFVLCDRTTKDKLPEEIPATIVVSEPGSAESFPDAAVKDDDLVNVMFTSGSTGKPKGVMLKHRSVSSLFVSIRELLSRADGGILCTTNVVFDSFIGETLFPLAMGKTIMLADEEEMMLPWKLAEIILEEKAEIFQVTPARLQMCLGNSAFCEAVAKLKLVLLGGEVLTPQLLSKLHEKTDAISVNMYGPTEATVYMTMIDVKPGDHITIGRPLYNSRIYVLDEQLSLVPPTGYGELYMAGECLAKGYISNPELTEKAFVPDPFFPGQLMYKSGDIGRMRLDGSYDFLGRKDSQVKLNGQRVELDEITCAIIESKKVTQAATVAVRKEDGSMELCSFFESSLSEEESTEAIKKHLQQNLPVYMCPSRLIKIEKIPLTPSSKIDLQLLKKMATEGMNHVVIDEISRLPVEQVEQAKPEITQAPEVSPIQEAATIPETVAAVETQGREEPKPVETEDGAEFVLSVWRNVLTKQDLAKDVSFFQQGGTSLDALSVLSLFFNQNLAMSLSEFYEHPTAIEQAEFLGLSRMNENQDEKILITGATGFFGAHLTKVILEKTDAQVVCLMRDGSMERLMETFHLYFGDILDKWSQRITVVKGNIFQERLGLSDAEYERLVTNLQKIYHCAADVRHYAADTEQYLQININGTKIMIDLAKQANASFYHMSTCSVSGEHFKQGNQHGLFTEDDYDIGQKWEDNIYVRSKFEAEGLVFDAIENGLNAKIFRLGRLVGRSTDGMFQKNPETNAFYLLMRAFYSVGAIPKAIVDVNVDLTPIDYAAESVYALTVAPGTTFHIIHPKPPTVGQVTEAMNPNVKIVENQQFTEILMRETRGANWNDVAVLLDYWYKLKNAPPVIDVTNLKTQEALANIGFNFPIPSPKQLLLRFPMEDSWKMKEV